MALAAMESDEQLAARTALGDRAAFATLYERHFQAVYDLSLRMARDPDLAADGVQQTFVKAWESLQRAGAPDRFKAWICTIARNTLLDELRRGKRFVRDGGVAEDDEEARLSPLFTAVDTDRLADPENVVYDREMAELVWQAAAALNPADYSLLDLHLRQGLGADEIAEYLGQRKGTVYTMLSRLRDALEESVALLLLVRRGRRDCPELDALLAARDAAQLDRGARRALRRHAQECPRCREGRRRFAAPAELFAAIAPVPVTVDLQQAIWARVSTRIEASPGAEGGARSDGGVGAGDALSRLFSPLNAAIAMGAAVFAGLVLGIPLLVAPQAVAPPRDPHDVRSASHQVGSPSTDQVIHVVWSVQPEAAAYSVEWSQMPRHLPDTEPELPGDAAETRSPPLQQGDWYFHLRTQARNGAWTSTVHLGPFLIRARTPSATPTSLPTPTQPTLPSVTRTATATATQTSTPAPATGMSTQVAPSAEAVDQAAQAPTAGPPTPGGRVETASPLPTQAPALAESPEPMPTDTPPAIETPVPTSTPTIAVAQQPATVGATTSAPTATAVTPPTSTPAQPSTLPPTSTPSQPPTVAPTQTPTVLPTETPTKQPTATPTRQPTATLVPTASPTRPPTFTPTPTPCPKLEALKLSAAVNQGTNRVTVSWMASGGCAPLSGVLTARYQQESQAYRTYAVSGRTGSQADMPPVRCAGSFTIVYSLSLRDGSGQQVSGSASTRVTWVC
jgi:RNA polymerase sigma factor (sigma-70 family)